MITTGPFAIPGLVETRVDGAPTYPGVVIDPEADPLRGAGGSDGE